MKLILSFFCLAALMACALTHGDTGQERIKNEEGSCLTKYPGDSADYKLIRCNLYVGKNRALYEKKVKVDKSSPSYCFSAFYDPFIHKYVGDSMIQIPLSTIIDISSFVCFDSTSYSKDKNNCYYYFYNSDGGFRCMINQADPASFHTVKNKAYDAEDKNHKYKNGEML